MIQMIFGLGGSSPALVSPGRRRRKARRQRDMLHKVIIPGAGRQGQVSKAVFQEIWCRRTALPDHPATTT